MPRIAGLDLPDNLRVEYALQKIYGIGDSNVYLVLTQANVEPTKRAHQLTDEEVSRIQKILDTMLVQGELRRQVNQNISRLQSIGSYRGSRHKHGLPARGQRTKSNARTKRGARKTVGAFKKSEA